MTEEYFIEQLERLGADVERWPPELQNDAQAILLHSERARAALKAMKDVEAFLLKELRIDGLENIASVAAHAVQYRQESPVLRQLSWVAAGVLALTLGAAVGIMPPKDGGAVNALSVALNGGEPDVL